MREIKIGESVLALKKGDLTREEADAIVNAANSSLLGGGGVDGAIHGAGGPEILAECKKLGGCRPGDAKITGAGRLPARWVIHTVGPIWRGGGNNEESTLTSSYRRSLEVAVENGARTVAFPSVSTGAYGFPADKASRLALKAISDFLEKNPGKLDRVTMVLFSDRVLEQYEESLAETFGQ